MGEMLATVAAMRIQVTEAMYAALKASNLGYHMNQRGEVDIKVSRQRTITVNRLRAIDADVAT